MASGNGSALFGRARWFARVTLVGAGASCALACAELPAATPGPPSLLLDSDAGGPVARADGGYSGFGWGSVFVASSHGTTADRYSAEA